MGLMTRIKTWWMSMTPAEKVSMAIGGIGAAAAIAGTMRCAKEMEKLRKQGHHIHITLDDGDSVFEGRCDGFGKGEAMKRIGDSPAKTPEPEKTENEEPAQESAGTALDRSMDILKTLWRHDDCPFSEDFCEAYDKAARILGLPYPGGPEIDGRARDGNPHAFGIASTLRLFKRCPRLSGDLFFLFFL